MIRLAICNVLDFEQRLVSRLEYCAKCRATHDFILVKRFHQHAFGIASRQHKNRLVTDACGCVRIFQSGFDTGWHLPIIGLARIAFLSISRTCKLEEIQRHSKTAFTAFVRVQNVATACVQPSTTLSAALANGRFGGPHRGIATAERVSAKGRSYHSCVLSTETLLLQNLRERPPC